MARMRGREVFYLALEGYWESQVDLKPTHFHPRVCVTEVDLCILFEIVRTLGGIKKIFDLRLFDQVRQALFIPKSATNIGWQLRKTFQRFCDPCYDILLDDVTTEYRKESLGWSIPRWLTVRMDLHGIVQICVHTTSKESFPDSSELQGFGYGSDCSPDDDDCMVKMKKEFSHLPEATQAAVRANMNAHQLMTAERKHLLFEGMQSHWIRSDIRNHIIREWYRNLSQRLFLRAAIRDIPPIFHDAAARVFTTLECSGFINFGVVSTASPYRTYGQYRLELKEHICIVGAGISGLLAARQLKSFGFCTTIIEAQDCVGGGIYTECNQFSRPVDVGAMIINGELQNPLSVLCAQTSSQTYAISPSILVYDINGQWVPPHLKKFAGNEFRRMVAAAKAFCTNLLPHGNMNSLSLGFALERLFQNEQLSLDEKISPLEIRNSGTDRDEAKSVSGEVSPSGGRSFAVPGIIGSKRILTIPPQANKPVCRSPKRPHTKVDGLFQQEKAGRRGEAVISNCPHDRQEKQPCSRVRGSATSLGSFDASDRAECYGSYSDDDVTFRRLICWYAANLESIYGAAASSLSLDQWDQDAPYGFQGGHVVVKGGTGTLGGALTEGLEGNIQMGSEVVAVRQNKVDADVPVEIRMKSTMGERTLVQRYNAVVVTVPLRVLKKRFIIFDPPLSSAKSSAIDRLGSGGLLKLLMEVNDQFWPDTGAFGSLQEPASVRGTFFMFWNMMNIIGRPILIGLVTAPSSVAMELSSDKSVVKEKMKVIRRRYSDAPNPLRYTVTRWSHDFYAEGVHLHVAAGSSGQDYEILSDPLGSYVFFAGKHTCKTCPGTCAAGVISSLREANRIAEKYGAVRRMYDTKAAVLRKEKLQVSMPEMKPTFLRS